VLGGAGVRTVRGQGAGQAEVPVGQEGPGADPFVDPDKIVCRFRSIEVTSDDGELLEVPVQADARDASDGNRRGQADAIED
jgi:hypothetical protein